ncbi:hypothetical protein JZ751_014435 [Albula glossodonta]|uniref:Uncharacterized protein n=1 Tax=Albula glossodonta TaxID=121402 RepID=A0A8T2MV72_9TELE|nr:hypothetical protein JZ751_014435 [Albula glossodonta]
MPAATEENMTDETTPPRAEEAAVPVRRSSRQASKKRVVLSPNEVKQKRLRYTEDKAGDPQKLVLNEASAKNAVLTRKIVVVLAKKPPLEAATVKQSEIMLNNENCDSDAEQDCPAVSLLSDSEAEQDCPAVSLLSDSEAEQDYPASLRLQKQEAQVLLLRENPPMADDAVSDGFGDGAVRAPFWACAVEMMRKLEGPVAMVPVNMEEGSVLPTELLELWKECTDTQREKRSLKE